MMDYKFQYSAAISLKWIKDNMMGLIFPDITKRGDRIQKNFKGVIVSKNNVPVGMILGLSDMNLKDFRIMSFRVKPDHENNKLGFRLLMALEDNLKKEGFERIELQFRSHWKSLFVLKKLLQKTNWKEPAFNMRICQSLVEQAFPVFHTGHQLTTDYTFTSWKLVSDQEKEDIKKRHNQNRWYPEEVSPFILVDIIEHEVSLALRYKDQIVGWLIIHQISDETLEYTSLFIDESHRSFKMGHLLMGEGILRQSRQRIA
jgi:GNAT superfamily N-acetyltransferase